MEALNVRGEEAKGHLLPYQNSHEFDVWMKGFISGLRELQDVKFMTTLEELEDQDEV